MFTESQNFQWLDALIDRLELTDSDEIHIRDIKRKLHQRNGVIDYVHGMAKQVDQQIKREEASADAL